MFFLLMISAIFFGLGLLGLWGCTWGPPLSALLASSLKRTSGATRLPHPALEPIKIDILIPAYNEEKVIAATIRSVQNAVRNAPAIQARTVVGLDRCTDQTQAVAQSLGCATEENQNQSGKWFVLKTLIEASTADWVALVDCGSCWDEQILQHSLVHFKDPEVICLSPSYCPERGGLIERTLWRFEQHLKSIESQSGGPTSVHGATVFYRREPLAETLQKLGDRQWLNDDVVIPFSLRAGFPERKLVYLKKEKGAWVKDLGVDPQIGNEYRRRKRIVLGNLQWLSNLLLTNTLRANVVSPVVLVVASRRAFRLFWAYWVLFLGLGFMGLIFYFLNFWGIIPCLALVGMILIGALASNILQRVLMAFLSGLQIPLIWFKMRSNKQEVVWA